MLSTEGETKQEMVHARNNKKIQIENLEALVKLGEVTL